MTVDTGEAKHMERRDFLKTAALATGAVTLSSVCPRLLAQGQQAARKPNIVFILADDLGYGDIRAYNPDGKIRTPNLDRLCREGMRFTDAHSGAAVCSPTRYGVLTGQHFSRVKWDRIRNQLWSSMIDTDRLTVGGYLRKQGYHTACFGKWHLGMILPNKPKEEGGGHDWSKPATDGPNDRGFDKFFGIQMVPNFGIHAFLEDGKVTEVPTEKAGGAGGGDGWPKAKSFRYEDVMPRTTEEALKYMDWNAAERPGKPFFMYYGTTAIHTPITPSEKFQGKSGVGPYGDFVTELDDTVGRLMAKLEEHGIRDNTLVIFTSDNGAHGILGEPGDHGLGTVTKKHGHDPNAPWRGFKGYSAEGGHRVPFIASWPGHIKPGTTCGQFVMLEDFMATCAAIVGDPLPPDSAEDSLNILPYLQGRHEGKPIRDYAVISTFYGHPVIRKGEWVLAFHLGTGGQEEKEVEPTPGGPQGQLFNLKTDPHQDKDLWLERQDIVEELTALYKADRARGRYSAVQR
jgi:arylsulfatase A